MSRCEEEIVIERFRGDDWVIGVEVFTAPDDDGNVFAQNITGWTITMTLKDVGDEAGTVRLTASVSSHTNPTEGETNILFARANTAIEAKRYVFDIEALTSDNKKETLAKGFFDVLSDVTRQ